MSKKIINFSERFSLRKNYNHKRSDKAPLTIREQTLKKNLKKAFEHELAKQILEVFIEVNKDLLVHHFEGCDRGGFLEVMEQEDMFYVSYTWPEVSDTPLYTFSISTNDEDLLNGSVSMALESIGITVFHGKLKELQAFIDDFCKGYVEFYQNQDN